MGRALQVDLVMLWGQFSAWMLDQQDWSKDTRRARLSIIRTAHGWIYAEFGRTLLRAGEEHLRAFLDHTTSARTRNTYRAALDAFYRFCIWRGYRRRNPMDGIRRVKEPEELPRPLAQATVRRLLTGAVATGPRAYVVVSLLLYTGLRRAEASRLRWADVDLEARRMRVLGKLSKVRVVPISRKLVPVLDAWRASTSTGPDYVFPSILGPDRALSPLTLYQEVKAAARAGRAPAVTTHRCRHTFATEYLKENPGKIRQLQVLLGHTSLASTQIYTFVAVDDLEADVDRLDFGR